MPLQSAVRHLTDFYTVAYAMVTVSLA